MTKYIDVDQAAIQQGKLDTINIRFHPYLQSNEFVHIRASDVVIPGLSQVRSCPNKPMPYGARVWIEVEGVILYKSSELLDYQRIA